MSKYAKRTDINQSGIVAALRKAGCVVVDASRMGGGFPDLIVGKGGVNILLEVKTESGKLNTLQDRFHSSWRGQAAVVRDSEEALRVVRTTVRINK